MADPLAALLGLGEQQNNRFSQFSQLPTVQQTDQSIGQFNNMINQSRQMANQDKQVAMQQQAQNLDRQRLEQALQIGQMDAALRQKTTDASLQNMAIQRALAGQQLTSATQKNLVAADDQAASSQAEQWAFDHNAALNDPNQATEVPFTLSDGTPLSPKAALLANQMRTNNALYQAKIKQQAQDGLWVTQQTQKFGAVPDTWQGDPKSYYVQENRKASVLGFKAQVDAIPDPQLRARFSSLQVAAITDPYGNITPEARAQLNAAFTASYNRDRYGFRNNLQAVRARAQLLEKQFSDISDRLKNYSPHMRMLTDDKETFDRERRSLTEQRDALSQQLTDMQERLAPGAGSETQTPADEQAAQAAAIKATSWTPADNDKVIMVDPSTGAVYSIPREQTGNAVKAGLQFQKLPTPNLDALSGNNPVNPQQ